MSGDPLDSSYCRVGRLETALDEIERLAGDFGYEADKVSAQDNEARFDRLADLAKEALR